MTLEIILHPNSLILRNWAALRDSTQCVLRRAPAGPLLRTQDFLSMSLHVDSPCAVSLLLKNFCFTLCRRDTPVSRHTCEPRGHFAGASSPLLAREFREWTRPDRLRHLYPLSHLTGPSVVFFKPTPSSASQGIPSLT